MPVVSTRHICFEHETVDSVPMQIRSNAVALTPGTRVEVEVGGRWKWEDGQRQRIEGHWVVCEVVADKGRELIVRLV